MFPPLPTFGSLWDSFARSERDLGSFSTAPRMRPIAWNPCGSLRAAGKRRLALATVAVLLVYLGGLVARHAGKGPSTKRGMRARLRAFNCERSRAPHVEMQRPARPENERVFVSAGGGDTTFWPARVIRDLTAAPESGGARRSSERNGCLDSRSQAVASLLHRSSLHRLSASALSSPRMLQIYCLHLQKTLWSLSLYCVRCIIPTSLLPPAFSLLSWSTREHPASPDCARGGGC